MLMLKVFMLNGFGQVEDKINKIQEQLVSYYRSFPVEEIFLSTDKDVYKPGEIIWFNGFIKNLDSPVLSSVSSDLHVALYDCSGNMLVGTSYRIVDGIANGELLIPEKLEGGKHIMIAYTSLMQNENEVFMKLIFIDPMDENEIITEIRTAPELLTSGANNNIELSLSELSGKAFSSNRIKYELIEKENALLKGKLKIENDGNLLLNLDIPQKEYEGPLELKMSDSKDFNFSRNFHVDTEKLRIRFYAEGGNFVAGTPLKVGYYVTNSLGQPVAITAEIIGEVKSSIMATQTLVPGFGVFSIQAAENERYQLKITSELGKGQIFDLPMFESNGFVCSVQKIDTQFVYADLVFTDKQSHEVNLLVTRGSRLLWASNMRIEGGVRAKIDKDNFPQGLCLLSVFDPDGELIGDRLFYVTQNNNLNISLEIEEEQIQAGQPFFLKMAVTPQSGQLVPGVMAVSVSADCKNIETYEKFGPCFFVNNLLENKIGGISDIMENGSLTESSLNYLLIPNRLKNYSWPSILNFDADAHSEKDGEEWLSGTVLGRTGDQVKNVKVSLLNTDNVQIMNVTADENGYFVFPGIHPSNVGKYVVKAIDSARDEKLNIEFDRNFTEKLPQQIQRFLSLNLFTEKPKTDPEFFRTNRDLFSNVNTQVNQKQELYKEYLRTGTSILDVIKMIKPYNLVDDKIIFPGGQNSFVTQGGALIVIDGQKMGTGVSVLNSISPNDIESINVSTKTSEILAYTGMNSVGLIKIQTKRGRSVGDNLPDTVENYEGSENRTTLYWNPLQNFSETGIVTLKVPTNNITGIFQIEVLAVDSFGRIGETVKAIQISK